MRIITYSIIKDPLDYKSIIESFAKEGLVNFEDSPPKISKELICKNITLHNSSSTLQKKLIGTWIDSINYLNEIEFKYGKSLSKKLYLINKNYKSIECTKDEVLAISTSINDIKESKDSVAREYLYVLKFIYRIRNLYSKALYKKSKTNNPFSPEFVKDMFRDENFEKNIYFSLMTYDFLEFSTHCHRLGEICKTPIGVPLSEETRKQRAIKAAMARHERNMLFGEHLLYEKILNLVKKLNIKIKYEKEENIKKFRNIHSFVKHERKLFEFEINEYKKMIGKQFIQGGPEINFGEDLDLPELVKLMRKWRSKDKFDVLIKNFLHAPKNLQKHND